MIIVERGTADPHGSPTLEAMFEARKRVFVDLLRWNVPVVDERFEMDQFDDESAVYVIVADDDGAHLGSARLLATTRPHILGDLYPALCSGPVPRGADIFEITRFCVGSGQGARRRKDTRNRLVSALVAVARSMGIRRYTGVAELCWLQQILAFGWNCRPLGPPALIGGRHVGALEITIDPATEAQLAANGIWVRDAAECDLARAA